MNQITKVGNGGYIVTHVHTNEPEEHGMKIICPIHGERKPDEVEYNVNQDGVEVYRVHRIEEGRWVIASHRTTYPGNNSDAYFDCLECAQRCTVEGEYEVELI